VKNPMLVAGIMSGTSGDGVDVALVAIRGRGWQRKVELLAFAGYPYSGRERARILAACDASALAVAELSRLSFWLGERFAEAVERTCRQARLPVGQLDLIASHGQTVYHQGTAAPYLGRRIASTLQLGEIACIAERTGVTTVGDFRVGDVAAGGQGAPLVPLLDYLLLRDRKETRVALNIGGIANVTLLPAGGEATAVRAFDTGPGNMVLDALVGRYSGDALRFDRDGRLAAAGKVIAPVLRAFLRDPYYRRRGPKSAGREQYGAGFAARWLDACGPAARPEDVIATATALTARSIAGALAREKTLRRVIASGGGVHNRTLMAMLATELATTLPGCTLSSAAAWGLPDDAKEAIAFAVLGHATLLGEAGNLPGVTGARHPVVLGKVVQGRNAKP